MPSSWMLRRVAIYEKGFGMTYRLHDQGDYNLRAKNNVNSKDPHSVTSQKIIGTVRTCGLIVCRGVVGCAAAVRLHWIDN
jgi:hypothetical protein